MMLFSLLLTGIFSASYVFFVFTVLALASLSVIPPIILFIVISCITMIVYQRRHQKRRAKKIIEEIRTIQSLNRNRYGE